MSPATFWTIAHLVLAASCFAVSATFLYLLRQSGQHHPYARSAVLLLTIFTASGIFHVVSLPAPPSSSASLITFGVATALAAAAVSAKLAWDVVSGDAMRSLTDLQRQLAAHNVELEALHDERRRLEDGMAAAKLELAEATQRIETTLRKSAVFVSNQDQHLVYTWVRNPPPGLAAESILGKRDDDIFPEQVASVLHVLKSNTLLTKEHGRLEIEIGPEGHSRWYEIGVDPMVDEQGKVTGITTAAVDVTARKRAEAQQKLLLRDVTHRAKNVLAVVNAVARQTASRTSTKDEFVERFSARVQSLARAHDLLVNEDWHGVRMGELVRSQLARFERLLDKRIVCAGPELTLGPEATQNLGLAIHELAHNAGKYGALSNEDGRANISWDTVGAGGDRRLVFTWEETGGPPVASEQRMGFGRTFIERAVGRTLDGSARLEFRPTGVYCRLEVPGYHLLRYQSVA